MREKPKLNLGIFGNNYAETDFSEKFYFIFLEKTNGKSGGLRSYVEYRAKKSPSSNWTGI
jgi:hypothetical protein